MDKSQLNISRFIDSDFHIQELTNDVREGLTQTPKELPPKWFYDEKGSRIFEEMMSIEEYYLSRREKEIFQEHAPEIARLSNVDTFVELGSGTSEKTLLLLEAMHMENQYSKFIPFDVDESVVRAAMESVSAIHPEVEVRGIVGDFHHHLDEIDLDGTCLVGFLGSTIGNFRPAERKLFLAEVSDFMKKGDFFLVGTDLVKDKERLISAYNDSDGINAMFNLNVLEVINRELEADFDLSQFEHIALYNPEMQWIEMRLKSMAAQEVYIKKLDIHVPFEEGEEILTEISSKFKPEGVKEEIEDTGMKVVKQWTDKAGDYMLTLSVLP